MNKKQTTKIIVLVGSIILATIFYLIVRNNISFKKASVQDGVGPGNYSVTSEGSVRHEINLNGSMIKILVESPNNDNEIIFNFSNSQNVDNSVIITSYISSESAEESFVQNFFQKDVTGDSIPELFVRVEKNASNTQLYEILQLQGNNLEHIKIEGEDSLWVNFDQIEYSQGFIEMTWHDVDARGKTKYSLEQGNLIPIKNVGFFWIQDTDDDCEIRVSDLGFTNFHVVGKASCSTLAEKDFDSYL